MVRTKCIRIGKKSTKKYIFTQKIQISSNLKQIKRYYKFRLKYPTYCENVIPSNEEKLLLSGILRVLPNRTFEGARVLLMDAGKRWNHKEISIEKMLRGIVLIDQLVVSEPKTQVSNKFS